MFNGVPDDEEEESLSVGDKTVYIVSILLGTMKLPLSKHSWRMSAFSYEVIDWERNRGEMPKGAAQDVLVP